jgi:hypothetical protein
MKNRFLKKIALIGLICAFFLPIQGYANSGEIKEYLEEKNPKTLAEFPAIFDELFARYSPVIRETTQLIVLWFFGAADDPQLDDIIVLTNTAVISAIARADAEMSVAAATGEDGKDRRSVYITDAVCGSYKGALGAAYQQTTASTKTVDGGLQGAVAGGVEMSLASVAVNRGIETCLNDRRDTGLQLYIETMVCVEDCVTEDEVPVIPPECVTNCL